MLPKPLSILKTAETLTYSKLIYIVVPANAT